MFLTKREGKKRFQSGINTEGVARGTIPEGNEVWPPRWGKEHRFHHWVALWRQRNAKTSQIYWNPMFFNRFFTKWQRKMAFKKFKISSQNYWKTSNQKILLFLHQPQSKFVYRQCLLTACQLLKKEISSPRRTAPKKWNIHFSENTIWQFDKYQRSHKQLGIFWVSIAVKMVK